MSDQDEAIAGQTVSWEVMARRRSHELAVNLNRFAFFLLRSVDEQSSLRLECVKVRRVAEPAARIDFWRW